MANFPTLHSFTTQKGNDRYGDWDIEISNNNCYVDGEKGHSSAKIHFNDLGSDVCAPTLQMLQTIDSEGNITDTFKSREDGHLILVGGDFIPSYIENVNLEVFDYQKCTIMVECAPIGSDNWQTLNCNEIKKNFTMPGWGAYWFVDLDELIVPDGSTQFALRISLTDEAGNYQQQTLWPVFTILTPTNVGTISNNQQNSVFYNLQGFPCDPSQTGILIERTPDGYTRKVKR